MDDAHLTYEVRAGVAHVTLDRPARRNAISANPTGTRDQLLAAVHRATDDPDVGCVLLAGNGPSFSVGGDLTGNARRETAAEHEAFLVAADAFHTALPEASVPIVAAVHGDCLGAGLLLAVSCDLVVAAESARFGLPEGRIGLVGGTGLVASVGRQWATFLMLTGESVPAPTAARIGIALTVVPDALLAGRTTELAQRLARMPRHASALNKAALNGFVTAAGEAAGRRAGIAADTITLTEARAALAPDGRSFASVIAEEGVAGLKTARAAQWTEPWLDDTAG